MHDARQNLIDFLVADIEATESTDFATNLLAQAKAAMTGAGGDIGFLTQSIINGKQFTRVRELSMAEVAAACRIALDLYAQTPGSGCITFLDFNSGRGGCFPCR